MIKTKLTPSEYLDSLPVDSQVDMRKLHTAIAEVFKGEEIVMWEGKFWGGSEQRIVGYGDFRYQRSDKETVEWFVVGLALQKNYITVFINAVSNGKYLAEEYKAALGKVKVGRSSISFKKLEGVNWDTLMEVVQNAKTQGRKF